MGFLQHQEGVKSFYQPRHPFVALNDMAIVSSALLLVYVTDDWLRLYFVVVVVMFTASALHHWLSNQNWNYRLDRSAIQVMIAGTPLPYAEYIFANGDAWWLLMLGSWAAVFVVAKALFGKLMYQGFWPSVVYVVTGLLAVVVMVPVSLQSIWWSIIFWLGVGLYVLQLFSYNRKWFDFFPERFGYREVQHLILLVAVGCHALAALLYL
jgi:hemolysin III